MWTHPDNPRPAGRTLPGFLAALLVALLVVLAVSCSSPGDQGGSAPSERAPTGGPTPGAERPEGEPTSLRPGSGLLLGTPVYDGDFADPQVLRVGNVFYAYATNTTEDNLPVMVAGDGPVARYHGDAFPELPSWSEPGFVWAPAVVATEDGFVLYYTTRVSGTDRQCISRAVATDPLGPFVDDSDGPMVCQLDLGGSIDPSVVQDDEGTRWLLFKNDGNCCGLPTTIWSQELALDGLSLVGPAHPLLTTDREWEGALIEGPSMISTKGRYLLFYSANSWNSEAYGIGYAWCDSVTGPCEKPAAGEPWMSSTLFARGPGGQEFFEALGEVWMVYHGWAEGEAGAPGAERRLFLDVVDVEEDPPRRVGQSRGLSFLLVAAVAVGVAGMAIAVLVVRRRRGRRRSTVAP